MNPSHALDSLHADPLSLSPLMQRCGAFIVVSDFVDIPDSGPVKVLLVKVLRMLKKSVGEEGDDSVIEQALVRVIEVVLEKKTVASLEYFGRALSRPTGSASVSPLPPSIIPRLQHQASPGLSPKTLKA